MNDYSISVGIVTRNRSAFLYKCLSLLTKQSIIPKEVIVVDNNSTDSTREVVEFFSKVLPIKYISESSIGTSFARNKVLKESKTEILTFIDDDCEVSANFLEKIIKAHEKYPKAAAIQGRVITLPEKGIFPRIFKLDYTRWVNLRVQSDNKCHLMDTANVSFKMRILKKNNIKFDTHFKHYCDDVDLAFQLLSKGKTIIYNPEIEVKAWTKSNIINFLKMNYLKGVAQAYLFYKWSFYENYYSFSIGKKRILIKDKKLLSFRSLSAQEQFRICDEEAGGFLSESLYRLCRYFSEFLVELGIRKGNRTINIRALADPKGTFLKTLLQNENSLEIAVVTRNRQRSLERLLFSLLRQTILPKKIIIVDNASSDKTKKIVNSFSKALPIKYVYEKRIGIANARNRAIQESSCKILTFIDDDCEASPNWIEEVKRAHKKFPRAVAIQGKVVSMPADSLISTMFETNYSFWLNFNRDKSGYLRICDTKNISFNIRLLKRAKIQFDRNFVRGSDIDLAKQIINHGLKIKYFPNVIVRHWERKNLFAFFKQLYFSGKAQARVDFKWPHLLNIFRESDGKAYLKLSQNMGLAAPSYERFLLKFIFNYYNKVFNLGYSKQEFINRQSIVNRYIHSHEITRIAPEKADVSVGIVTKDRPEQLENCLFSLLNQTKAPAEVIIIDGSINSSSKKIATLFKRYLPIKYIYEKRGGISRARNKVIQLASKGIIACIDDDCEALPDWIEQMLYAHKKYPSAVAIQGQCKIYPASGVISHVLQEDYNLWINRSLRDNNELLTLDLENSSFKKSILDSLEVSFDDFFKKNYYCEDIDFGFQLLSKKQKIIYWPQAKIKVWRRSSFFALLKQRQLKGLSRIPLDSKWLYSFDSEGMTLARRTISFEKNAERIKKIAISSFTQKRNYINPAMDKLPKISFIGQLGKPILLFLFHYIYSLMYNYKKTKLLGDLSRIDKLPLDYDADMSNRGLSLSVMVITKDREESFERCLDSLVRQTRKPDEVIVIDSSLKPLTQVIDKYKQFLSISYFYERKRGFGVARNTALIHAKGDILATLDDDAQAQNDWCQKIEDAHRKFPQFLAIQGRIHSTPKDSIISIVEQVHIEKWFLGSLKADNRITTLSTKNISFKLRSLRRLNLKFREDPLYGLYGSEDLDMAFQIISRKKSILYIPNIIVFHNERGALPGYLSQQYRKGYSNGLIAKDWKNFVNKKNSFIRFPKPWEIYYRLLANPQTGKNLFRILTLLFVYYLADYFFLKGKNAARNVRSLAYQNNVIKHAKSLIVVVLVWDSYYLKRTIYSLLNQRILPTKVMVADVSGDSKTAEITSYFANVISLDYLRVNINDLPVFKNEMIVNIKEKIVAFIDGEYQLSENWIEEIIKEHKKYSEIPVIQGRTFCVPRGGIYSTIVQFNRQSLVRDSMSGNRDLYWKWIKGDLKKDFSVFPLDLMNTSLKPSMIKKLGIKFGEDNPPFADAKFSYNVYQSKKMIMYSPKIFATDRKKNSLVGLMKKGASEGEILASLERYLLPKHHKIAEVKYIKRYIAFLYYCFKNSYLLPLPLLAFAYLIYQASFLYGWRKVKVFEFKGALHKMNNI